VRGAFLFLLLAACTVPPDAPVKESPVLEKGIAEAPPKPPPAPPKPKPQKPVPATPKAVEDPLPPCPETTTNPKRQILQALDCLIIIKELKP
jgi:hypothetical protein